MTRLSQSVFIEEPEEKLLNIAQFSEATGISPSKVWRLCKYHEIKHIRSGVFVFIPVSESERLKIENDDRNHILLCDVLTEADINITTVTAVKRYADKYSFYQHNRSWCILPEKVERFKMDVTEYLDTEGMMHAGQLIDAAIAYDETGQLSRSSAYGLIGYHLKPAKKVFNRNYYCESCLPDLKRVVSQWKPEPYNGKKRDRGYSKRPVRAIDAMGAAKEFKDCLTAVEWLKSKGKSKASRHAIYQTIANSGRHTYFGLKWEYVDDENKSK